MEKIVFWPKTYKTKDGDAAIIRPAAYGDARVLHLGWLEVTQEGTLIGMEPEEVGDLTQTVTRIRNYMQEPLADLLVAEVGGNVVGAISIKPGPCGKKDKHWRSFTLWLVAAARGKGVGSALLQGALEWVRQNRVEKVIVEVFSNNQAALGLYEKFGFTTEGRQKNLFVLPGIGYVDNILMALNIEP